MHSYNTYTYSTLCINTAQYNTRDCFPNTNEVTQTVWLYTYLWLPSSVDQDVSTHKSTYVPT